MLSRRSPLFPGVFSLKPSFIHQTLNAFEVSFLPTCLTFTPLWLFLLNGLFVVLLLGVMLFILFLFDFVLLFFYFFSFCPSWIQDVLQYFIFFLFFNFLLLLSWNLNRTATFIPLNNTFPIIIIRYLLLSIFFSTHLYILKVQLLPWVLTTPPWLITFSYPPTTTSTFLLLLLFLLLLIFILIYFTTLPFLLTPNKALNSWNLNWRLYRFSRR